MVILSNVESSKVLHSHNLLNLEIYFPLMQKIIAFDSFGTFPDLSDIGEKKYLKKFINDAGEKSITKKDLINILKSLNLYENIELVKGDITKPQELISKNSHLKSLC